MLSKRSAATAVTALKRKALPRSLTALRHILYTAPGNAKCHR